MHEFSICILHLKKFQNLFCLPPPKKSLTPTSRTKWPPPPEDICRMAGDELRMSWGCFRHSEPCTILCSYCYLFGSTGVWTQALHSLGWCSTSWATLPVPISYVLLCSEELGGVRVELFCTRKSATLKCFLHSIYLRRIGYLVTLACTRMSAFLPIFCRYVSSQHDFQLSGKELRLSFPCVRL